MYYNYAHAHNLDLTMDARDLKYTTGLVWEQNSKLTGTVNIITLRWLNLLSYMYEI